jgi:uncharacterized protein YjbI with pentapeptide repeats
MPEVPDLGPGGDYRDFDLSAYDWAERDLTDLQLTDCIVTDAQLSVVLLPGARFTNCRFVRCRFAHADLRETVFTHLQLRRPGQPLRRGDRFLPARRGALRGL